MKLVIDAPDEIVEKGFEGPLTDEERQVLIRAIGNGTLYKARPQGEWTEITHRLNLLIGVLYSNRCISESDLNYIEDSIKKLMKGGAE